MTRTTWLAAGVLACGLSSVASSLHADVLHSTREQPLVEVAHTVDVRISDGVATYTVRRMFHNAGTIADEAGLAIDLPAGAAATGMRIRAHQIWYDGELMERAAAAARYQELTGMGAYKPKDPALLQWLWADKLYLQIFPIMPGHTSTIEYTLTVPTQYVRGELYVSYPRTSAAASVDNAGGLRLATPVITVHPAWGDSSTPISIDGNRVAADTPIALVPPPPPRGLDGIDVDPSASTVASAIVVAASSHTRREITAAKVTLDISHTYKSDLRVELIAPSGERVTIHDRTGGSDNDVKGTFPIALKKPSAGAGTWRLVVSDHAGLDTGTLTAWTLAFGDGADRTEAAATDTPIFIPDAPESAGDAGVASIEIAPPPIETWHARLGRVIASTTHAFARLEVDVAPQLRALPKHAQVVFAIDASYSIGEPGLAAELDVVRAYLAHVPDAEIELVAYRRRAARVFGTFVPATGFEAALHAATARGALALGNGSALDDGARVAAAALVDRHGGPRRVVLVTDELLRDAFTPALAIAALAPLSADTVVHVVVPTLDHDDTLALSREDGDRMFPIARAHHGIVAALHGLPVTTLKRLTPEVLELVRPTRIDDLQVVGLTVEQKLLHEGDGLRLMIAGDTAPSRVVLTGQIWSDPVRREVIASDAFSRATAAFVFGADDHHELSDAEMMRVALMGRAVSPVTSYVAAEPGTRPSTVGFDQQSGFGYGGASMSGRGMGYGVGRAAPDLRRMIDAEACVRSVKPAAGWRVSLAAETTKDEIVDVGIAAGDHAMAACLVEATWRVRLDAQFDLDHEQFSLSFGDPSSPE